MGRRIHNTCHTCPHAGLEGGHQHQFVNFPFVLTICSPHSTCLRNCTNYGLQLLRPTEIKPRPDILDIQELLTSAAV
jgi:hypothetical protein